MALLIISLFVLAPFSLLVLDLAGRAPKRAAEPLAPVAPSYSHRLEQTGRGNPRSAPSLDDVPAAA